MGAGASISSDNSSYPYSSAYLSSNGARLRRVIVMRAYNLQRQQPDARPITFEEQFEAFAYKKDGSPAQAPPVVCVEDVATALQLPPVAYAALLREMRRGTPGAAADEGDEQRTEIDFKKFVEFLETGDLRVLIAPNIQTGSQQLPIENGHYNAVFSSEGGIGAGGLPPPGAAPRTGRAATSFSDGPPTHFASAAPSAGTPRRGMPPTPPRHSHHSSSRESEKTQSQHDSAGHGGCMYREVFSALGFMCPSDDTVVHSLTPSRSQVLVPVSPGGGGGAGGAGLDGLVMPPGKPLWRKREVVRSERIVHYTTVDASGLLQELVEKESTETEVLHMECRETGEFAHRETTKYEQLETFNNEVVAEEKGKEEYVHLKSLDDEIEYMESNMPRGRGSGGGPPPQEGGGRGRGDTDEGEDDRVPRGAEGEGEDAGRERQQQGPGSYSPPRGRRAGPPPHVVPPGGGNDDAAYDRGGWGEEDDYVHRGEEGSAIPGYSPAGFSYEGSWQPHDAEVNIDNIAGSSMPSRPPRHDCAHSPGGEEPEYGAGVPTMLGQTFAGLWDEASTKPLDLELPLNNPSDKEHSFVGVNDAKLNFADSDIDEDGRSLLQPTETEVAAPGTSVEGDITHQSTRGGENDAIKPEEGHCVSIADRAEVHDAAGDTHEDVPEGGDGSPTQKLRRFGSFDVD